MNELPVVWPMKCKALRTQPELDNILRQSKYIIEEKIKGIRGVIHFTTEGVRVCTRGSSKYDPDKPIEITHRLPHFQLADSFLRKLNGTILDCELFTPELDDAEIAGKLNARSDLPPDSRIKAYIFDILKTQDKWVLDYTYEERHMLLNRILEYLTSKNLTTMKPVCSWIRKPKWLPVSTPEVARAFVNQLLDSGGEGVVLKNKFSNYIITEKEFKRAGYWYKFKRKDTTDAIIIGAKEPDQFYSDENGFVDKERETKFWENGWIGSLQFTFVDDEDVTHTGFCSGIPDDLRARLTDPDNPRQLNPRYLGRYIEVEFFEVNGNGNLEHPRLKRIRDEIEK